MSTARPRILLTGGRGQIGWELRRALAPLGDVLAPGRGEIDLAHPARVREAVQSARPKLIVNAAAYTAVDRAESEPELARAVNALAPTALAEEGARLGAVVVHFSTDYVFDGRSDRPWRETDPTGPLGVYGATKLEGEHGVASAGGAHLILRTSWVYGLRGHNFLRTMRRLARERDELRVVDDQIGAPTWSRLIAEATAQLLARAVRASSVDTAALPWGTYHLSAGGATSWHGFATAILDGDPARARHRTRTVTPIATADFPTPARRPRYSVLDGSRIEGAFGIRLPDWRVQLALVLDELATLDGESPGG